MNFRTTLRRLIQIGPLALAAGLLVSAAQPQPLGPRSPPPDQPEPSEYQNLPFTARYVEPGDPRFRMGYRLEGGVSLVSRDRTIYSIAWINGLSSGTLRDGRGVRIFPRLQAREGLSEVRVARTMELAGGYTDRRGEINPAPPSYPNIPGYRFVLADSIIRPHFVGLWRRNRRPDETLIVGFQTATATEPAAHQIFGRVPLRLNSIYLHGGLHIWYMNVISEASVGRPIYILTYALVPARNYLNFGPNRVDTPAR